MTDVLMVVVGGWIVFWLLYGIWVWLFHTELDLWPLALLFAFHWLIYHLAVPANPATRLAWFVIGPLVGSVWLTIRAGRSSRNLTVVLLWGVIDLLLVTGAMVPLLIGLIYVLLTV